MLEKYADQILGAVLTGGGAVLTAALAWSWKRANDWWNQPRVVIEVSNAEGHIYENVLIKSYPNGVGGSPTQIRRDAIFVRAKVTNKEGKYRTPGKATGCVGYLAGLEQWDVAKCEFSPTKYQDFLRLEWSFNKESHGMDLLPGIPVWLDVVYVLPPKIALAPQLTPEERQKRTMWDEPQNHVNEPTLLKIASNPPVHRYMEGFEVPGMYRVKVQVSGENCGAQSVQFYVLIQTCSVKPEVLDEISWRGRLSALEQIPVEQVQAFVEANSDSK
ncbi:hypothetical protein VT84_07775 [Gemmata sp. SH-PL17]|uniref:hypothetical protein n=1 Tax=Gemmata sp. SH-PL17 TaxID=1630693 RepID=UPI000696218B|nr:hypothetical protein [Gemmata sp. SH-PL17]AMV24279.1 hypothetical protein VT84_07775 [Gemmata sp. SH-PL17]